MKEFEFVENGVRFFCSVEAPRHEGMPPWWWFRMEDEPSTRHAPFAASPDDTEKSVRKRVLAYYADLLAIRARPVHQRPSWHNRARINGENQTKPNSPTVHAKE
ncbi:MAG TPA: hypothetical protein VIF83_14640 [Gemmatimonadaceae bacterium]|jgi:hypothetical protein